MIKSMTGFASLTRDDELATIGITLRSVNHRYLDLQLRLPPFLAGLEPRIRAQVQNFVTRGRVEVSVALHAKQPPPLAIELNESLVEALQSALDRLRAHGVLTGGLTVADLLRLPQALTVRERLSESPTLPAIAATALTALEQALAELEAMRTREGRFLGADLDRRRAALADLVEQIAAAAEAGRAALETRLSNRVRELRVELHLDPAAVAQEVVRLAARSDISEELVRLRGHLVHWQTLAEEAEPCGRKLDFLLQEMQREINTIGAKVEGPAAPDLIVEAKAELERMREQVQNVE